VKKKKTSIMMSKSLLVIVATLLLLVAHVNSENNSIQSDIMASATTHGQTAIREETNDEKDVDDGQWCFRNDTFNEDGSKMTLRGHVSYAGASDGCDFVSEPCAPLNDCWAYSDRVAKREYAVVGLANGVDVVDVTDSDHPVKVQNSFFGGCLTEWRDVKSFESAVYVVNDHTTMCECFEQPCQFQIKVLSPVALVGGIDASLGRVGKPLEDGVVVSGALVRPPARMSDGCVAGDWQDTALGSAVAIVDRGNCSIAQKLRVAQAAGAVALVVVSQREDTIVPSMSGNSTGIEIPVAMVRRSDGERLRAALASGATVRVAFDSSSLVDNPLLQPPDGLRVIDMSVPTAPRFALQTNEWFDFAHNLHVDPRRPLLYAVGMDTMNGGLLVLDVGADPLRPQFVASWNETYLHDVEVAYRDDLERWVAFGTAIYDGCVYVLDVTEPSRGIDVLARFETLAWPHNTASTADGRYLYLTHEDLYMPITIWRVDKLERIEQVGNVSLHVDCGSIPHNVFIRNDRQLFASYYNSGVAAFDIADDPANPRFLAANDSMVDQSFRLPITGFHGVWGIDFAKHEPLAERQLTYASDIETGLWVVDLYAPLPHGDDDDGTTDTTLGGFATGLMLFIMVAIVVAVAIGVIVVVRRRHLQIETVNVDASPKPRNWGLLNDDDQDDQEQEFDGDDELDLM
jgi:PA domain